MHERMFEESDREEAIALHREEWRLLAANPALRKDEVLEKMGYTPENILHHCFLCQYSHDVMEERGIKDTFNPKMGGRCQFCPVVWPMGVCTKHPVEFGVRYLFADWNVSDSIKEKICH